jgi:SNF2 family DNA or RNA helicase
LSKIARSKSSCKSFLEIEESKGRGSNNTNTNHHEEEEDDSDDSNTTTTDKLRDLYSEEMVNLFESLNYDGEDTLNPKNGMFFIDKMPSKYLVILWYIIEKTNIVKHLNVNNNDDDTEKNNGEDEPKKKRRKINNKKDDEDEEEYDDQLIVFTRGTSYLDHMASFFERFLGINVSVYAASNSIKKDDRENQLNQFRSGKNKVILISLALGSNSLNIPEANHVILADPWYVVFFYLLLILIIGRWNPQVEEQAKRRIARLGQTKKLHYVVLTIKNSMDDLIHHRADGKSKFIRGLFPNSSGINRADMKHYRYFSFNRDSLAKNCDLGITNNDNTKNNHKNKSSKTLTITSDKFKKNVEYLLKYTKSKDVEAKVVDLFHIEKKSKSSRSEILDTFIQSRKMMEQPNVLDQGDDS